jgi:serine/threonine protein kinase
MTKIFLSYRREDSADVAGRIFDHLERRFGRDRLFLDVDAIRYGDDFRRRISEALDQTGVLLAIIGDRWLDAEDRAQPACSRRLDDPNDYVSVEISAALKRGIAVVPVLVGEARMPSARDLPAHLAELSYRNAAEVRSGRDFSFHINRLIEAIADLLGLPPEQGSPQRRQSTPASFSIAFKTLEDNPKSLIGVQLGAFVIERLLAAGGSGVAYAGRNPRTGQQVCVKISLPVLSDMEGIRRALSRGIRGLVALSHPHIVRVHEFDGLALADARSFYVVMDYVDGVPLDQWASKLPRGKDGVRDFIRIAHLVARALEAAHACRYLDDAGFETVGVMHGDVKPGNIVVRPDGTPCILDFMMVDVQRALDPVVRERFSAGGGPITAVFGTPGFMAPEQEREGIVTVRTDVYSLGATLRATASGLSVPADLTALLDRMTGPLNARPQDMGEVARLLSDVSRRNSLDGEDTRREPPVDTRQTYLELPAIFRLRVLTGPHAGTVCALSSARVTVGRSEHNDVVLAREPSLSRSHFALNWSAERRTFVAVDFAAHDPVLINGEPLAGSRPLAPGDRLTVGSTQLVFETETGRTANHQ